MEKDNIKQLVVDAAKNIAAEKNTALKVTVQSKWKEELDFNMLELGEIFIYVFKHGGLVTDVTKLKQLYAKDNMSLEQLAEFMANNIVDIIDIKNIGEK